MKKIYSLLCFVTMSFLAFSQTPILTMISDGDCSGGTPKVVEIYAQGTVDFSLYSLEIQTNSNTTWGSTENLGALGMVTDAFVYVYGSAAAAIFALTAMIRRLRFVRKRTILPRCRACSCTIVFIILRA